jgi:hypothetical protein
MVIRMTVLVLWVGVCLSQATPGIRRHRREVRCQDESRLAAEFPEADPGAGLFTVDERYLLRDFCDAEGRTARIVVAPKYFFNGRHPEWTEPGSIVLMPWAEYVATLRRIAAIKPLGTLLRRGSLGVSTNARTRFLDQYDHALVERDQYGLGGADPGARDGRPPVAEFTTFFYRPVSGRLQDKKVFSFPGGEEFRVNVDGSWYWTHRAAFRGLRISKRVTLDLAGPILDPPAS